MREWMAPGTKVRIQLGTGLAALSPYQAPVDDREDVVTVADDGTVALPNSVQRELGLSAGDSVLMWNEGKRLFLERRDPNIAEELGPAEKPDAEEGKTSVSLNIGSLSLPAQAPSRRRLWSRRRYGWAEPAGSRRYEARLHRAPVSEQRPWRGEPWVATARTSAGSAHGILRDVSAEGQNIPQALGQLWEELQEGLRDSYRESPSALAQQRAAAGRSREPEVDLARSIRLTSRRSSNDSASAGSRPSRTIASAARYVPQYSSLRSSRCLRPTSRGSSGSPHRSLRPTSRILVKSSTPPASKRRPSVACPEDRSPCPISRRPSGGGNSRY